MSDTSSQSLTDGQAPSDDAILDALKEKISWRDRVLGTLDVQIPGHRSPRSAVQDQWPTWATRWTDQWLVDAKPEELEGFVRQRPAEWPSLMQRLRGRTAELLPLATQEQFNAYLEEGSLAEWIAAKEHAAPSLANMLQSRLSLDPSRVAESSPAALYSYYRQYPSNHGTGLGRLPNELIELVGSNLSGKDRSHLGQTSRQMHQALGDTMDSDRLAAVDLDPATLQMLRDRLAKVRNLRRDALRAAPLATASSQLARLQKDDDQLREAAMELHDAVPELPMDEAELEVGAANARDVRDGFDAVFDGVEQLEPKYRAQPLAKLAAQIVSLAEGERAAAAARLVTAISELPQEQRSPAVAALVARIGSLPEGGSRWDAAVAAFPLIEQLPDAHMFEPLAAMARQIKRLPEERRVSAFNTIRTLAARVPAEQRPGILAAQARSLERLPAPEHQAAFDATIGAVEGLSIDLRPEVFQQNLQAEALEELAIGSPGPGQLPAPLAPASPEETGYMRHAGNWTAYHKSDNLRHPRCPTRRSSQGLRALQT
jgi:hypothetical protein